MMKLVLPIILTFSCVFAYKNSDEFINEINSKQNLWKAGRNFHKDIPISRLRGLLGAKKMPNNVRTRIPIVKHEIKEFEKIPESFDARTHWPKCKLIKEIVDQSACASCWAVSVASSIQDRICIHSDGKFQPEISAKNLMSCETSSLGCLGGFTHEAFEYWISDGLVTGGQYGSKVGCQPYPFAPCAHDTEETKPSCPDDLYDTPQCVKMCDNSTMKFQADLHYGKLVYALEKSESQIQLEIMMNGPVVTIFNVYEDFFHYKSGVYSKTSDNWNGGHAVRIIGWGIENGIKYWLTANSWNEEWGDKGFFKILRGTNECEFEENVLSGLPKIK